jgi:hypothetical protein
MVMTDFSPIPLILDAVVAEGDELTKEKMRNAKKTFFRNGWEHVELPEFTKELNFLYSRIPTIASEVMSLSDMVNMTKVKDIEDSDEENHLS